MSPGLIDFHSPEGPAWFFVVVLAVVIIGPLLAERARLAGIVGLLIGGFLIGPEGLDLISGQEEALNALGEVGLLYLMFLAGLELDLKIFNANRNAAIGFGGMTFALPFALGTVAAVLLDFDLKTAILIGSLFASHTLLVYPQVRAAGVAQDRAVAVAVGGTVITDTAALLTLAVVAGLETGDESGAALVVGLGLSLVILGAWCFVALPRLGRWFFEGFGRDRNLRFVFIFLAALSGAVVAEVVGIEGIVGAFFAGLAVNRLVPNRGPLMDRVEFFGAAFIIPMFLISVGLLIDPGLMTDPATLGTAAVFAAVVIAGKLGAAILAGRRYSYDRAQVGTVFGLSVAQAAATLAAATTGLQIGLIDAETLNAIVIVIVVSVLVASWAAARYARRIEAGEEEIGLGATILVPRGPTGDSSALISLAARVAAADGGVVVPLHVALSGDQASIATARSRISELNDEAAAVGVDASAILRVAETLEEGVAAAIAEQGGSMIVLEHSPRGRLSRLIVGRRREPVGASSVPVALVGGPAGRPRRVLLPLEPVDLGPAGPRGAAAAAVAFAGAAAADELPLVIAAAAGADGLAADLGLADLDLEIATLSGGRGPWLAEAARAGDLVVLPGRSSRISFGSSEEALLGLEGVTVAAVVTPHGSGVASAGEDLGSMALVGRAESSESLI